MSRLLVVISRNARLEGVVADDRREEQGAQVLYLHGTEVARAQPGEQLVLRNLPTRHCARVRRVALAGPTIAAAG